VNRIRAKSLPDPVVAGLVIFALALAARVAWVLTLKPDFYWSDERGFAEIARGIVAGHGYVAPSYRANPVLPVYLSVMFGLFGENLLIARLGQCIAGALTCVLIYRIAARLFCQATGVVAGMVLALYPSHIYLSGVFYAECLLIFWGALAVYLAVRAMQPGGGPVWAALAGVALGLSVLTRSTLLVWIPAICVGWVLQGWHRWRLCVLLVLASAATILPWTVRNYVVYGAFVPVHSGFGTILWQANNPFSTGRDHSDWDLQVNNALWLERLAQLPEPERSALKAQYDEVERRLAEKTAELGDRWIASDRLLGPLALRYIATHPVETAVRAARRLRMLFSPFSPTVSEIEHTAPRYKLVAAVSFYPVLVLAVAGMVLALRSVRRVGLLYLLIVSVVGMTALLLGTQTRYRLPVDPYLVVFASFAAVETARRLRGWRR
jgi:4-amino-4-deoxy-L-arabinose transferase-like glycosyltransferase